jgi:hypothetical protein
MKTRFLSDMSFSFSPVMKSLQQKDHNHPHRRSALNQGARQEGLLPSFYVGKAVDVRGLARQRPIRG